MKHYEGEIKEMGDDQLIKQTFCKTTVFITQEEVACVTAGVLRAVDG